jgi:hypothetical protein
MEQEMNHPSTTQAAMGQNVAVLTPPQEANGGARPVQEAPCPTCGAEVGPMPLSYIYALGRIEARFPTLSVEKEFAQAGGRAETAGQTDQQVFHAVLSKPENRYLVHQMCWVFTVQGLETYLLHPRHPDGFALLVDAIRPVRGLNDIDIVVGVRGPIAPAELCNGLMVPIVGFDQIYSFDHDGFIEAIPKPQNMAPEQFGAAAQEVFDRIMQLADNVGATDEHRALNYLAARYPAVYARAAEEFARDFALTGVETRPSRLSATRRIVEVIFSDTSRNTDFIEKFCAGVDTTEEFLFLRTKLSPYYDR